MIPSALLFLALAQPASVSSTDRKIVTVPAATTLVEEKSVNANPTLAMRQEMAVRPNTRMVDMKTELPNGVTYYLFELAPLERLKVGLDCETLGKAWMQFMKRPIRDGMDGQITGANRPPVAVRSQVIQIQNVLDKPYQVLMAVYGFQNYAYKLKIDRSQ